MTQPIHKGRFKKPVEAVLLGVTELIRVKPNTRPINPSDRLEGKTCLITGEILSLGLGVARRWAQRAPYLRLPNLGAYPS